MKTTFRNIDEYIKTFPPDVQEMLQQIRECIQNAAPDASEAIKYNMPTFVYNGNLVHFAAYKKHIGFYPTPSGLQAYASEIVKYKNSKGAVQFPLDKKLPLSLVRKIVKFRVKEANTKIRERGL